MAIRVETDPMGMGGQVWRLSSPAELEELPADAAALVAPRVAELFLGAPRSIEALASEAPLTSMQCWLRSLAPSPCTLEVFQTPRMGDEARLRFPIAESWAPSFRGVHGVPTRPCPALLAAVHAVTGHVDTQYGCSGTLVALDELTTLGDLVEEHRVLNAEELRAQLARAPLLRDALGFYEVDGDWLCVTQDLRTFWAGAEWVREPLSETGLDLPAALDAFFHALSARRSLRPA